MTPIPAMFVIVASCAVFGSFVFGCIVGGIYTGREVHRKIKSGELIRAKDVVACPDCARRYGANHSEAH